MVKTSDYHYLLDVENVKAVEWDEEQGTLIVRVSHKVEDIEDEKNVQLLADVPVTVISEFDPDGHDYYEPLPVTPATETYADGDRGEPHRPVLAGVSEIHYQGTAATAGAAYALVVDTSKGRWAPHIEAGDLVRTSNNHVYADFGDADFGDDIIQPSPRDGGRRIRDISGQLVGYVPFEDGVTVDIAARTRRDDRAITHELDDGYGHAIYRGDFSGKGGEYLIKSGRTTGVTEGIIENTSASVNVRLPTGVTRFDDVVVTPNMGSGGDSGSPAFFRDTGELCAKLFAGSPAATIFCKVKNIEEEFGVEYQPNGNDAPEPPDEEPEPPESLFCRLLRMVLPDRLVDFFC